MTPPNQNVLTMSVRIRKSCQNMSKTTTTAQRRSNVNSVITPTKRSLYDSFAHNMYLIYVPYTITLYDKVASDRIEHTTKLYGRLKHYFSGDQKHRSKISWMNPVWIQSCTDNSPEPLWMRVIHGKSESLRFILIFWAHSTHERTCRRSNRTYRSKPYE